MIGHLKVIWRLAIWFLGSGEEIGFSIQCLMLVGVMKLAGGDNPTLESNEMDAIASRFANEKSNTP
jgi:multicomponent Na+:H+ antiporter subunit C